MGVRNSPAAISLLSAMDHVTIGSRVYYKDNGPEDAGTIVDILLDDFPFVVKWDKQERSEWKTKTVKLMGLEFEHTFNPADENIDRFRGSQLCVIQ
jgi:hypothetical protein